jgi:hypothetical protein
MHHLDLEEEIRHSRTNIGARSVTVHHYVFKLATFSRMKLRGGSCALFILFLSFILSDSEAHSQCSTPTPAAPSGLTLATMSTAPTPTNTPTVTDTGLVAYWKFDERTGSTACDSSGKGNNGILASGPLWAVGKVGGALYFDGVDDNVTVADSNSLDVSSSFTLSAWVNPASSFTDFRSILVKNYKYYLYASAAGSCGSGNPLAGFDEQTSNNVCHTFQLPINTWTHLAVTYTGSVQTLYRNGVAVATSNVTKTLSPSSGTLQIGASQFGENFKGVIDEVRIHNRALTNSEIQAIFLQEGGGTFSFSLANSGNKTVVAGSSLTNSIAAALESGISQPVSFTASGLPSGATGTFSSASCTPVCSTVLTINTTGSTPAGSFPVIVTSTGGGVTRTTAFTLSVTLALTGTGVSAPPTNTGTGVTYYVATNGSNSNTCMQAQNTSSPKLTIAAGIECLRLNPLGNRLEIRGGTYAEPLRSNLGVTFPAGTSWSNAPVIASYAGEAVIIRPNSGAEVLTLSSTRYLIFDGLILDAANINDGFSPLPPAGEGYLREGNVVGIGAGASHIRFQNGELKNAGGQGVLSGASFLEFINMKIHHNGDTGADHGLYLTGSDILIEKSEIYSNSSFGVHIYDGEGIYRPSRNIVRNNIFHSNGAGIIISSYGTDNRAYNNIIRNNKHGIQIHYGVRDTKVYNNTVYGNSEVSIQLGAGVSNSLIKNNILYQNGSPIDDSGTGTIKVGNLTSDPKFVSPAANNFHLQSISPAIDAGVILSEVATDFDGMARPRGQAYDIGAFEY